VVDAIAGKSECGGRRGTIGDVMKPQPVGRIEDTFDLSPEEEADLEAAIAEADAGLLVPLEDVLRRMRDLSSGHNHRRFHESTTA
jgi:hypothetical protein